MRSIDPPLQLVAVKPTGAERVKTHNLVGNRKTLSEEWIVVDTWPDSPQGRRLGVLRQRLGITVRQAGYALGLTAEQVWRLETGAGLQLESEAEWTRAREALIALRAAPKTDGSPDFWVGSDFNDEGGTDR